MTERWYCAAKLIRKRGSRSEQWARARGGGGGPGTTADTMGGPSRRSDLRPLRLCTTAFAFGFVRSDCVLMPRFGVRYRTSRHPPPTPLPLYTPVAANSGSTISFVVPFRSSRAAYRGEDGGREIRAKPREEARRGWIRGRAGLAERINRVSGGLAPEFQTFPVNRRRGRGGEGSGWQGPGMERRSVSA